MKNKKGFTLIEILAVIIIIGIIAIIAIPSISRYLGDSKNTVYTTYEHTMEDAAKNRIINCITNNVDCDLPAGSEEQKIYLDLLIEEGYLDNMKDPESSNFCNNLASYVTVKGKTAGDYQYNACLYCGDYLTDSDECIVTDGDDGDNPVCGETSGDSTRWTNQNRTVTIGCSDQSSGCEQLRYSKTFKDTTPNGIGTIAIRDRSGNATACEVNAYVDKTLPTCNIEVVNDPAKTGEYITSTGWYSMKATAAIQNMDDVHSGLLTYGMGTSTKNREYNKQNEFLVNKAGITTVIGYVKDKATNEGLCAKEIKVGTEIPKFNMFYGYFIYPNKESATKSDATLIVNNTNKYKEIEKVIITLSTAIPSTTTGKIKSGTMEKTATMQQGSKEIEFLVPKGTYNSLEFQLGTSSIVDNITKIELLTKDGSTWTNKDITMYVETVDAGMRTTEVSFENGVNGSWISTFHKTMTTKLTNNIKTKNGIGMESLPVSYTTNIDKTAPTVTIKAEKSDGSVIPTDTYVNSGLSFTINQTTVGESGAKIYYCKDTNDSCTPTTEVTSGQKITTYNTITSNYYIRYMTISISGTASTIYSYGAKFDLNRPGCTFGTMPDIYVNRESTIPLNCTDDLSGVKSQDLSASNFTLNNGNLTITGVTKESITNGIRYNIKVKGVNDGDTTITLKENQFTDSALNGNTSVEKSVHIKGVFKVTLNNQSATTAGTTEIYELYTVGWYSNANVTSAISSITRPARNGYIFGGYYTSTNGGGTQIIDANGNIVSGKQSTFTADGTLYAKWTECGNGSYCTNNTKTSCPAGTYGNGATTASTQAGACQACGNGAWCTGGTARSTCPGGTYGNGTTNASSQSEACQACGNGAWCTGGTARSTCPAGTYGNGTTNASTQAGACKACGSGAWCTGGTARSTCPSGTYSSGATNATTQAQACLNGCGSGNTYDSPSCTDWGGCSVTYQQQSGTKSRTCTHKYYSNKISGYLCSTGSNYTETTTCTGSQNACGSGNTYDSPSCGDWGGCSATCRGTSGTQTRSCTHNYYSNKISGYLCSTGTNYTDSQGCSGGSYCWVDIDNYPTTCYTSCEIKCTETYNYNAWACTLNEDTTPSSHRQMAGPECWCSY